MNLFNNGQGVFQQFCTNLTLFQIGEFEYYFKPDGEIDIQEYLQKGEKIMTLLRKEKEKIFREERVLELVKSSWKLTQKAAEKQIGTELEKKFIDNMEEKLPDVICEEISNVLLLSMKVHLETREKPIRLLNKCCDNLPRFCICISYPGDSEEEVKEVYLPVGAKFRSKYEGLCKLRSDTGPYIFIRNFRPFIVEIYLKKYILNYFQKLFQKCKDMQDYLSIRLVGRIWDRYFPEVDFVPDPGMAFMGFPEWVSKENEVIYLLLFYNQEKMTDKAVLHMEVSMVQDILQMMQKEYLQKKEEAKLNKKLSSDYAASFQTKKNIPRKCLQAMSRSGFNRYFGYVEFDEECDLNLIQELYLEYEALMQDLVLPSYPEVSLRFRKLGKYKAGGLYFPSLKCLCVDIRSPGSMVHEVGHMIDYHCGHISERRYYTAVYDRYRYLFDKFIQGNDTSQTKILCGRTKYNCAYYLQNTEVFARCFEIYLMRIRKIDNSLCKPVIGFAYPEDEQLTQLIEKFFNQLLLEIRKK